MRENDRWRLLASDRGFTLVELLVVLIVIAILLGVAVASYVGYRERSAEAAVEANIRTTLPAIGAYLIDNGTYVGISMSTLSVYDQTLSSTLTFSEVTATSYCAQDIVEGIAAHQNGPGGEILLGAC